MKRFVMLLVVFLLLAPLVPLESEPLSLLAPLEDPGGTPTLSADGNTSSDSITSFSETLADDVLFYPDAFALDLVLASAGVGVEDEQNSYTLTQAKDGSWWTVQDYTSPYTAYANLSFTVPTGCTVEAVELNLYSAANDKDINLFAYDILAYDTTNSEWDVIDNAVAGGEAWHNNTVYSGYSGAATFKCSITPDDPNEIEPKLFIDYAEVVFHVMTLADSSHYAESFADVSDWAGTVNSPTTDGDILSWEIPGDNSYDYLYTNTPSFAGDWEGYIEFRIDRNASATYPYCLVHAWTQDSLTGSATALYGSWYLGDGWITYKAYVATGAVIECVSIRARNTNPTLLNLDYWRMGDETEMGWQHDCSTAVATSGTASVSSDGDKLNISASGGTQYMDIEFDNTAMSAIGCFSYYPFFSFSITSVTDANANNEVWYVRWYDTGDTHLQDYSASYSDETGTFYINLEASAILDNFLTVRFYCRDGDSYTVDWAKAYSIANFTYTASGMDTDDYCYVDSGALVFSDGLTYPEYITWNHDPALSVAVATHNVWNITSNNINPTSDTDFEFRATIGGSEALEGTDESRGDWSNTGTLTDLRFTVKNTMTISAIKFIEDGTAPDILDKYIDPPEPSDDETVTITAVTSDAVEVYKCVINAVVYPTGFSDIDYEMTEQTDNVLWSYDFATLTAGYYLFQIEADDGANTYSEYITVRVRAAEILLDEISFFGVGEDFVMMTFSFKINKDCTYSIYEESAGSAEAETHTGSVTEGMNNIAWTKLSVTDVSVNFTIKYTNGTLTKNVTGQYSVAQITFAINDFLVYQFDSTETVKVVGYATKLCTYTITDDDGITQGTGTITDQDFEITFSMWGVVTQYHNFTITFTNGSSTVTKEGAFYRWKNDPDTAERGGAPDPNARAALAVGIWSFLAIFAVGIGVLSIGRKEGNIT